MSSTIKTEDKRNFINTPKLVKGEQWQKLTSDSALHAEWREYDIEYHQ